MAASPKNPHKWVATNWLFCRTFAAENIITQLYEQKVLSSILGFRACVADTWTEAG